MSTKGKSNQYSNTRGSAPHKPTKHINFKYAKRFNKSTLSSHYDSHHKEFQVKSKKAYEQKAIKFANKIDHRNCKSVVDRNGTTLKYNVKTREFVMVRQDGTILTYHHKDRFDYIDSKGERVWVKIK